jgi:2'-5' RNA ligase
MKPTRTFIAIDPGKAIRDRAVSLQESLAKSKVDVKWVESSNLHLTLLFLGEVDQRDLAAVCRVVAEGTAQHLAFSITIEKVGAFPNSRRPRTLWVGVGTGSDQVIALHGTLEARLLALGCYRREERAFEPHLTLGRVKLNGAPNDLSNALAKYGTWCAGETSVRDVLVMGSELKPEGPVYTILSRASLG